MYRTLSSTNTTIDGIDPDHEDTYIAAVEAELDTVNRETHSDDHQYRIVVTKYADPIDGTTRFAVHYTDPASTEITDHDNLVDAEHEYEDLVVAAIENAAIKVDEDGNELPVFASCDVEPTVVAAHRAAEQAEAARREAQADAEAKATQRAVAVAKLVDAFDAVEGRGGVTEAARRLSLEKATVSALVKKARTGMETQPPIKHYGWMLSMSGTTLAAGDVYAPDCESASVLAMTDARVEPCEAALADGLILRVDRAGKSAPLGGWIVYDDGESHHVTPTADFKIPN